LDVIANAKEKIVGECADMTYVPVTFGQDQAGEAFSSPVCPTVYLTRPVTSTGRYFFYVMVAPVESASINVTVQYQLTIRNGTRISSVLLPPSLSS
jgi:hypothetical protein